MTKIKCMVMVNHETREKTSFRCIKDENGNIICYAEYRTMEDYKDEVVKGNNECACLVEKFERIKNGKTAYLWQDIETLESFISYEK